jgi:hypothetical protein
MTGEAEPEAETLSAGPGALSLWNRLVETAETGERNRKSCASHEEPSSRASARSRSR